MQLSSIERSFVEHVERGEAFDAVATPLSSDADPSLPGPVVRASVIRGLLLKGIETDPGGDIAGPRVCSPTPFGVRLNGALIEGRLVLDGLSGRAQKAFAPLHLTGCTLAGGLSGRRICVAELYLNDCVVSAAGEGGSEAPPIDLDDCIIDGRLDLSGMRGASDEVPCWVSAQNARIGSLIAVVNSRFFYPPREVLKPEEIARYALSLRGAVIGKSLQVSSGSEFRGGLSLRGARVGLDVFMLGSRLSGGEGPAFDGQSLALEGNLIVAPEESRVDGQVTDGLFEGEIKLFGARIGGGVWFSGIAIVDHPLQSRPDIDDVSVNLARCRIGSCFSASFWKGQQEQFRIFKTSRHINLSMAVVGEEVGFFGVEIGASLNDEGKPMSLTVRDGKLGGACKVGPYNHAGKVWRSQMAGACELSGTRIEGDLLVTKTTIVESELSWLSVQNARVSGTVNIADTRLSRGVDLKGTHVDGNLYLALHRPSHDPFSRPQFVMVNLYQVYVGSLCVVQADVVNLDMTGSRIGASAGLYILATGNVSLVNAKVHGELVLDRFRFRRPADAQTDKHEHLLSLKGASIDGNLKIEIPKAGYLDDIYITGAWQIDLDCYPGFRYVEVEVSRADGVWYGAFLVPRESTEDYEGLYLCGGRSNMFHRLNENGQLDIDRDDKAKEYLRLFCASTWGDEGAFVIAESATGLPFEYADGDAFPPGRDFPPDSIMSVEQLPATTSIPNSDCKERTPPKDERFLFKAFVRYGHALFESWFSMRDNGNVDMVYDNVLVLFDKETVPEFRAPLRKPNEFFTRKSYFVTERDACMTPLAADDLDALRPEAERLIKEELTPHNFAHATIDLRDARVAGLDDDDGQGWGEDVKLNLLNFRYERFSTQVPATEGRRGAVDKLRRWVKLQVATVVRSFALVLSDLNLHGLARRILQSRYALKPPPRKDKALRSRIRQRLKWLALQYPKSPEDCLHRRLARRLGRLDFLVGGSGKRRFLPEVFEPQPYAQAAAVFRREGAAEQARNIDFVQRRMAGRKDAMQAGLKRPLVELLHGAHGLLSRYGLSPVRTFIWMLVFIAAGGLMVDAANRKGLLIIDALPVVQAVQEARNGPGELAYLPDRPGRRAGEVLCGNAVEPVLYAADIFIPLLDLEQVSRCMIRPAGSVVPGVTRSDARGEEAGGLASLRAFMVSIAPDNVVVWHWMQSVYAVMGWVMISLFVYTLTHKLRSQDTPGSAD